MKSTKALQLLDTALKIRNYSPKTRKSYYSLVAEFLEFVKGKKGKSYRQYVEDYLVHLRYSCNQLATSVNLCRDAISFFGLNVLDPPVSLEDMHRMKESKTMPEPLTRQEVDEIFSLEKNSGHLLILQIAYYGCLRLSDIQMLKVRDLRYDRGLIHIEEGKGAKDRYVPFPDCMHDLMRKHTAGLKDTDYVFRPRGSKGHYPDRTLQKISENAGKRAQIPGKHNIHRFRHTGATHMIQRGVNLRVVQEILGHTSPKTTMLYTRIAATDISNMRNILSKDTYTS